MTPAHLLAAALAASAVLASHVPRPGPSPAHHVSASAASVSGDAIRTRDAAAAADTAAVDTAEWTGSLAMELRLATLTRVPLAGSQPSVTTSLLLVDSRRGPHGYMQVRRVCEVRVRGKLRVTVPARFTAAFAPHEYAAAFPGPGGPHFRADLGEEAIGYDPAVTHGAVPAYAEAPGVLDGDGDGHPGATITGHFPVFGAVGLYFAQRTHLVLDGATSALGRIEGRVTVRVLEQRTLGASNRLFARTLQVVPDAARSGFTLVRAPAVRTCADLHAQAATLFRHPS